MSEISLDDHINIYNNLTDIDFKSNDLNFLKSIEYKMDNGNKLLNFLLKLKEFDIPFNIIKGFTFNEEYFSKFERCQISINEEYVESFNNIIDGNIIINKLNDGLYELSINIMEV